MTEIANRQQADLTPTNTPDTVATSATVDLQKWALELDAAHKFGRALATSNFVPQGLRMKSKGVYKTPEELANDVTAIILAGKSVGYDPMQSVQQLFIVHGMPSMYARSMVALVLSHGHELRRGEASERSVTWNARRKGETDWQAFTWTLERAERAGYTSNPKYKTNPTEMLSAKASTEACRVVFPDVLQGIAYSVEETELEDLGEAPEPAPQEPAKPKRKVTRRKQQSTPAPSLPDAAKDTSADDEPTEDVDTETGEVTESDDGTDPATPAQIDAVVSALDAAGHTTKAAKQTAIADALGEQKSATQLTSFEADMLARHFTEEAAA
ncbi:hypothetical protein [Zhihengliuella flava]|uniref:Recombinase RecT n=1 Tax=Zhihengliuella flava TaxID=1285193 RepID=A0A931DFK3_9MICC|nr:hypothetical protein [Zhihengliuella flava]MBG6085853.1 hypothetical protein [Zhihengliuella flava]